MTNELTELPEGWEIVKLKQIASKIVDGSHNPPAKQEKGLPMLSARNIDNGKIDFDGEFRFIEESAFAVEDARTKINAGDVLLTIVGAIGRAAVVPEDFSPFTLQRSVAVISPSGILPDFLKYQFHSSELQREFLSKAKGTAQKGIYLKTLGELELVMPPLNEQKRIVAKIEELSDRLSRAKAAIEGVSGLCDRFRQSVLAAAFRGDLTADWREQNPDVEPASVLLERIRGDRQTSLLKRKSNLKSIDLSSIPEIPDTWDWERLINISNLLGGVTKGRKFNGRSTIEVPYLRVANVQDDFLNLEEIKEIEVLPEDIDKYRLEYGDILFTEGGDRDKLGRGTIWRNEIEGCIHQNHVYRARVYGSEILPEYISLATKTKYAKDYFFQNASQTVNLTSINITTLGSLPLAIPPLEEQKEICLRVSNYFRITELIKQDLRKGDLRLEQ